MIVESRGITNNKNENEERRRGREEEGGEGRGGIADRSPHPQKTNKQTNAHITDHQLKHKK